MEQGYEFSSGELEVSFQGLKARHVRYTTCSHFDGGKSSSVASLSCSLDQLFIFGFFLSAASSNVVSKGIVSSTILSRFFSSSPTKRCLVSGLLW